MVAETRGNPLALLELPRGSTPAEMAGGFGLPDTGSLTTRIEGSFRRRLGPLAASTRMLLLVAAAEGARYPWSRRMRAVLRWSFALVAVVCVIVYLQSTAVLGWMVP